MPKIPEHIIDQILESVNIVDVVMDIVPLKKTGANYKACCPFHQEKTPSFVVSPDKQIFHCFGCGVGGNVVGFLMQYEKIPFPEAIEKLAERCSINLPTSQQSKADPNKKYFKINAYAQWFFAEALKKSPSTQAYLKKRGISEDTQQSFALGFAPEGFENLVNFLKQKKAPLNEALTLGLLKYKNSKDRPYDFYRNRLMFPIHNLSGNIIGFGGRDLSGKNQAKYINSSESPIYHKTHELYGLHQAKKSMVATRQAIVVEGYIDVLACHQVGLTQAIAPLGTSLTTEQVKIISRYADDIVLMFDGDTAGQSAALKSIDTCLKAGKHPRLVWLPQGTDPGDALTQDLSLNDQLANATHALDWLFAHALKTASQNIHNRVTQIKELATWIKKLPDTLMQAQYRKKLGEYFDLAPKELQKMVEMTKNSVNKSPGAFEQKSSLEHVLVACFVEHPEELKGQETSDLWQNFEDSGLKKLAQKIDDYAKKHETFKIEKAISWLSQEEQKLLSRVLLLAGGQAKQTDISHCIQKFLNWSHKKQLKRITAAILHAETQSDTKTKIELLKQKQEILSKLNREISS